jgi:hypothetical protein
LYFFYQMCRLRRVERWPLRLTEMWSLQIKVQLSESSETSIYSFSWHFQIIKLTNVLENSNRQAQGYHIMP